MNVVSETEGRTTRTPAAEMAALAAPSQGSSDLSTWRVRMDAEATGPVHAVDREQVWMPVSGALVVTSEGRTETVTAGQALVIPAGAVRQVSTAGAPAEVLVCMPAGGRASVPGQAELRRLPWAE